MLENAIYLETKNQADSPCIYWAIHILNLQERHWGEIGKKTPLHLIVTGESFINDSQITFTVYNYTAGSMFKVSTSPEVNILPFSYWQF